MTHRLQTPFPFVPPVTLYRGSPGRLAPTLMTRPRGIIACAVRNRPDTARYPFSPLYPSLPLTSHSHRSPLPVSPHTAFSKQQSRPTGRRRLRSGHSPTSGHNRHHVRRVRFLRDQRIVVVGRVYESGR